MTYDILGPTQGLFSFTNEYASCIPLSAQTSGGTQAACSAAARITMAMTIVADREMPHWQLWQLRVAMELISKSEKNLLNKATLSPVAGGIGKGHSGLETVVDKVLLAMRPL